jgi:hypothetical protein
MRYLVVDEDGKLLRKFWDKESAQRFLQEGWTLIIQPRVVKPNPTPETHGRALW